MEGGDGGEVDCVLIRLVTLFVSIPFNCATNHIECSSSWIGEDTPCIIRSSRCRPFHD